MPQPFREVSILVPHSFAYTDAKPLFDNEIKYYRAFVDIRDLLTAVADSCTDELIITLHSPFTRHSVGGGQQYEGHTSRMFSQQS